MVRPPIRTELRLLLNGRPLTLADVGRTRRCSISCA